MSRGLSLHTHAFLAIAISLSACSGERSPVSEPASTVEPPAMDVPQGNDADANAPATPAPVAGGGTGMPGPGTIRFDGFGPATFGAGAEQVRMAWGRDLGEVAPAEAGACHYLYPQPQPAQGYRIAFMIEGDRFTRIDVRADDITAPGGGRVGMDADAIAALYPGRVERRPHKYVEGGQYLRIQAPSGDGVLVFATDAADQVTEWRIGLPPQVDYVEGCS